MPGGMNERKKKIINNYLSVANRYRFMREVGTDECTQGNSTYSLVSLKIELRSIHLRYWIPCLYQLY